MLWSESKPKRFISQHIWEYLIINRENTQTIRYLVQIPNSHIFLSIQKRHDLFLRIIIFVCLFIYLFLLNRFASRNTKPLPKVLQLFTNYNIVLASLHAIGQSLEQIKIRSAATIADCHACLLDDVEVKAGHRLEAIATTWMPKVARQKASDGCSKKIKKIQFAIQSVLVLWFDYLILRLWRPQLGTLELR